MATTTHRQNQQSSQNFRNNQNSGPNGGQNSGANTVANSGRYQSDDQNHNSQSRHGPVESFRLSNVSISIFENESERDGQKSIYHRAKIDKRYRDQKSGEWKSTTSFSLDELLRLQHLINNAVDFMASKPGE